MDLATALSSNGKAGGRTSRRRGEQRKGGDGEMSERRKKMAILSHQR